MRVRDDARRIVGYIGSVIERVSGRRPVCASVRPTENGLSLIFSADPKSGAEGGHVIARSILSPGPYGTTLVFAETLTRDGRTREVRPFTVNKPFRDIMRGALEMPSFIFLVNPVTGDNPLQGG